MRYVGLEHFDTGSPRITRWDSTDDILSGSTEFVPGDVLFSKLRPYLRKVAVADFDGRCTNEALVYRPTDPHLLPSYLGLLLQDDAAITHADASSAGSRMPRTSIKLMSAFPIALPPLMEQRRIVDLIAALDDTIEAARDGVQTSRAAIREIRNSIFTEADHGHESVRANEIFDMLLGRQKSARQSVGDHVIPYLRAANISSAGFLLEDVHTMNFDPKEQEKYCLTPGDVMLVEGGSLGQSAMWEGQIQGPIGFDKHVIRLRGLPGRSTSHYALQWTRWSYEQGAYDAVATGATIRALGFGRASNMLVPDLTLEEQHELVAPLTAADEVVDRNSENVDQLRQLRSNLLTALLSGEHEIPASYDDLIDDHLEAA